MVIEKLQEIGNRRNSPSVHNRTTRREAFGTTRASMIKRSVPGRYVALEKWWQKERHERSRTFLSSLWASPAMTLFWIWKCGLSVARSVALSVGWSILVSQFICFNIVIKDGPQAKIPLQFLDTNRTTKIYKISPENQALSNSDEVASPVLSLPPLESLQLKGFHKNQNPIWQHLITGYYLDS